MWKRDVTGYLWNLEITYNAKSKTWHPHIHIVYDGAYIHWSTLVPIWKRYASNRDLIGNANVGSCYLLRPVFQPSPGEIEIGISPSLERERVSLTKETAKPSELAQVLKEVTKYSMKPFHLKSTPGGAILELTDALHNKRLFGSSGTLDLPPADPGEKSFRILGGLQKVLSDPDVSDATKSRTVARVFADKETALHLIHNYETIFYLAMGGMAPNVDSS